MQPVTRQARELTAHHQADRLQAIINAWLEAKYTRSRSPKTRTAYTDTLGSFRAYLADAGIDLDYTKDGQIDAQVIALAAQKWAALPKINGKPVAPSTVNHRLAVVSSFYDYARKHGLLPLVSNPLAPVDRAPVQDYAAALPIPQEVASAALAGIDRSTLKGLRDYAILALGLYTGRRLSELARLQLGDIEDQARAMTVHWLHCKGGKVMHDELPPEVREVMLDYLLAAYGDAWRSLDGTKPVWVSFARTGRPVGIDAIANICRDVLGTSKSHAIRHTAAKTMEDIGMPVSDIAARLGHSSIATTGIYLKALASAKNRHGGKIVAALGIAPKKAV